MVSYESMNKAKHMLLCYVNRLKLQIVQETSMHNPPNSSESQDCADQILQAATVVASFYHLHADNYTFYWRIAHFQHRHLRRLPSTCIIGCSHHWTVWYSLWSPWSDTVNMYGPKVLHVDPYPHESHHRANCHHSQIRHDEVGTTLLPERWTNQHDTWWLN